jgi:SAM-dependent methyltransferase
VTRAVATKPVADVSPEQTGAKSRWQFPGDFLKIDNIYLPVEAADRDFEYSDGDDAESYVHQAIRRAGDCSSTSLELERHTKDWPSAYHLSRQRTNLLRPFPLRQYPNVLEIGAGCGAITRYLGESCAQVTALEGSRRRAAILRDRCRDLSNVTCIAANLADVQFSEPFDLIVVIGVLEYAGKYFTHRADPYAGFLKLAAAALRANGLLILAIENQLGLKYFQGDPEDHTGRRYEGIEGYYSGTSVRTFGRDRLLHYVEEAGFQHRLFLPFPDYKLPRLLINGASTKEGLRLSQWYDCHKNDQTFSDALVLPALESNGLLADFANSFLVLASKQGDAIPSCPWSAVYYSLNRKACYQTQTRLQKTSAGYLVSKTRLFPQSKNGDSSVPLRQVVGTSPYAVGEKLSLAMLRALRHEGVESRKEFEQLLSQWHTFLLGKKEARVVSGPQEHARNGHPGTIPDPFSHQAERHDAIVPADCIDCTPFNLILTESGLREFDQEWILEREKVTVGWILFRGLYWLLAAYGSHIRSWPVAPGEWGPFIQHQFATLGYSLTRRELLELARQECRLQQAILPGPEADQLARTMIDHLGPASRLVQKGSTFAKRGWRCCRRLASAVRNSWRSRAGALRRTPKPL